jgi:hypothetical protein
MARVSATKTKAATPKAVAAKATAAKNRPALSKGIVDSQELAVAPEKDVKFTQQGAKEEIGETIEVENNLDNFHDKARKLKFLEELVTINISEGTEKDAEKYVFIAVNGVGAGPGGVPWVPRGVDVTIKRKYLNVLVNARHVRYKNQEQTNNAGVIENVQKAYSGDRYPFQVVEDTAQGREWLRLMRATRRAG